MTREQKFVLWGIALLGLVYFALFIPVNLTGARDPGMLAVFETDEYAQYPHVIRMLTPGDTVYQSIRNFAVYLHYYYGYPFYFFSALALLPLRLILGADWTAATPIIVLVLRQMLNVLPAVLAAGLLTWVQTRFKPAWLALSLFAFLLAVPAVVVNDFWWHPDGLLLVFVALTFYFLDRDQLRFGRNFYFAAAAVGLATGAKHLGLFFFLAVPVYILYGIFEKKISLGRAIAAAALFVVVLALTIVITNPLLLLPQERAEIIATQRLQWQQSTQGYWTVNPDTYFSLGQYPEDFRKHYGEILFILLALVALGLGIYQRKRRLISLVTLAWIVPFMSYFLFVATTRRTHYFIPVILPLFAALVNLFPAVGSSLKSRVPGGQPRSEQILWIGRWAALMLIVFQAAEFLWQDALLYREQAGRERTSLSLQFTDQMEPAVLDRIVLNRLLVVYHDWKVYVPEEPSRRIEMLWDLANYDAIAEINPDVILLERGNVEMFSPASFLENALNPGNAAALHKFYGDAARGSLQGYTLVYQDGFALAFVQNGLYQAFFKP